MLRALPNLPDAHLSSHNAGMVEALLRAVAEWASEQPEIHAVGVVGSQARGTARPDSDVDLVMIVRNPAVFFASEEWINRFGRVRAFRDEDWGRLRSRGVHYTNGLEVEFGFVTDDWANTDPVDPGTKQVVTAGLRRLYDPDMRLSRLAECV